MRKAITVLCCVFLLTVAAKTCDAGGMPSKYKDANGRKWDQVVYDDGDTRVIYAGAVDFETELVKLKAADEAYPTKEVREAITYYELYNADNLVGVYLAIYTKVPIKVGLVDLVMTPDIIPNCRVVSPMAKNPYLYGSFNISPRVSKPAIVVVLAPKLYGDQTLSAITWR